MSKHCQNGLARPDLNILIQKHFADRARVLCLAQGGVVQTTRWKNSMATKPSYDDVVAVLEQQPESGNWQVLYAPSISDYTGLPELLDSDIALLKLGGDFQDILNNRAQVQLSQEKLHVKQINERIT